jgi:AAA domain
MSEDLSWARLIDWEKAFYGDPEPEIVWAAEPFLEQGTVNSLYSEVKAGKSYLVQDIAAAKAAGRSVLGYPALAPEPVLYLDFENSQGLITERMRMMGYTAADLKLLHYASVPDIPPYDTPEGGEAACRLAYACRAGLVIVDTTSRIIRGNENSADTFADLYKYTLMRLKRAGHTSLRLDHEGKDPARGARGSSAKGADVDVSWHLAREHGDILQLHPEFDRARHVEAFRVQVHPGPPLRHLLVRTALSGPQMALAEKLNGLGVPRSAGREACRKVLRAAGVTCRTEDLAAAVKARKTIQDGNSRNPGWRILAGIRMGQVQEGCPLGHRPGQRDKRALTRWDRGWDKGVSRHGTTVPPLWGDSPSPSRLILISDTTSGISTGKLATGSRGRQRTPRSSTEVDRIVCGALGARRGSGR